MPYGKQIVEVRSSHWMDWVIRHLWYDTNPKRSTKGGHPPTTRVNERNDHHSHPCHRQQYLLVQSIHHLWSVTRPMNSIIRIDSFVLMHPLVSLLIISRSLSRITDTAIMHQPPIKINIIMLVVVLVVLSMMTNSSTTIVTTVHPNNERDQSIHRRHHQQESTFISNTCCTYVNSNRRSPSLILLKYPPRWYRRLSIFPIRKR